MAVMKLKSALIACALLFFVFFIIGCGCEFDSDCNDGRFCNGIEICSKGDCERLDPPCPRELCDEGLSKCYCWTYEDCDDGLYCNGVEDCIDGECFIGTSPCNENELCNEDTDSCEKVVEKLTILYGYAEIPVMNTYRVYVQAKNTSGEQLSYAEIEVRMLDGDGEVFYEDTVKINGLNPDEVWNFEVIYTGPLPKEQSYEISVVDAY